jgi:hypothetical protein
MGTLFIIYFLILRLLIVKGVPVETLITKAETIRKKTIDNDISVGERTNHQLQSI